VAFVFDISVSSHLVSISIHHSVHRMHAALNSLAQ
jgi:hypothetical protein